MAGAAPFSSASACGMLTASRPCSSQPIVPVNGVEILKMMDWIPIGLVIFKVVVLAIGMFYAIKWHYDQGKKGKVTDRRALLRTTGMVAVAFVLALLVLVQLTLAVSRMIGLDMNL